VLLLAAVRLLFLCTWGPDYFCPTFCTRASGDALGQLIFKSAPVVALGAAAIVRIRFNR
jgi:hypothetical protein